MTAKNDGAMVNSKDLLAFYENDAKVMPLFGSLREISLAENINKVLPSEFSILMDIGCGEGYLLHALKKNKKNKNAIYFGLDLTEGRATAAKKNVPSALVLRGDVQALPFHDNAFDVVVCSEVLEHMEAYQQTVDELVRITKKKLIITVPNEQPIIEVMCPKCKTKHYFDGHVNYFSAEKLCNLFVQKNDCIIVGIRKFHTIYTYNRVTLKLPGFLRLFIDQCSQYFQKKITFLKPTFLLIVVDKR